MYKITEQKLREVVRKIILKEISSNIGAMRKPKLQKGAESDKLKTKKEKHSDQAAKVKVSKQSAATKSAEYKASKTVTASKLALKDKAIKNADGAKEKLQKHKEGEPVKGTTKYTYTDDTGKKKTDITSDKDPGSISKWTVTETGGIVVASGVISVLKTNGIGSKHTVSGKLSPQIATSEADMVKHIKASKASPKAIDHALTQIKKGLDRTKTWTFDEKLESNNLASVNPPVPEEIHDIGPTADYDALKKKYLDNDAYEMSAADPVEVKKVEDTSSEWTAWETEFDNLNSASETAESEVDATTDAHEAAEESEANALGLSDTAQDNFTTDDDQLGQDMQDVVDQEQMDAEDMLNADDDQEDAHVPSAGSSGGQGGGGYGGPGKKGKKGKKKRGKN
jgi:hypothetical protein